jgi:adenine-specific DNA-methyltransferase
MNNGAYFSKVRKFIAENSNIEYLQIIKDPKLFHGAQQSVMLLVIKKGENKGNYLFEKNGILIFSENTNYLKNAFRGKVTLHDLNFEVKTGRLVWNQNRNLLTHNPKGSVPLIWAHNITTEGLKIPITKKDKPQYIKTNNFNIGPAIVTNRITGTVKSARLKSAIIPPGMKFIAENHVNVIFPPAKKNQIKMDFARNPLRNNLTVWSVAKQLSSKKKLGFVSNITGNTQISKTELEKLFPISI